MSETRQRRSRLGNNARSPATAGHSVGVEDIAGSESPAADRLSELHTAAIARRHADELVGLEVAAAVNDGASWAQIGLALGVSKQAAHERYGKTIRARGPWPNDDGRTTA